MVKMIGIVGLAAMAFAATGRAQQILPDVPKTERVKVAQNYELKGDIARARESYADAVGYYRSAVRSNNKDPKLYNKLGIAYLKTRNNGQARKAFSQSVKLDPTFVNGYNNLGATECLDKKYDQAVRHLKQALALEETNASSHLNMAEAWIGLGQMDRAMTEYSRALELNADILSGTPQGVQVNVNTPEQRARVSYLIAKAYAKRGNMEGALEYLRRANDEHFPNMRWVYEDPAFTPLWGDPRLDKIVKRPS
jgi:tetratricopeptide (TPR) repeat protein